MQALQRIVSKKSMTKTIRCYPMIPSILIRALSTKPPKDGGEEWNDAWETAWLPEDLTPKNRASWEEDVNFGSEEIVLSSDVDAETKAFVEDMNDNWDERRNNNNNKGKDKHHVNSSVGLGAEGSGDKLYSLESIKKDYRLKKQRIHAALWLKEIEKQEEAKLDTHGPHHHHHDIDRLLDTCSEIFDSTNDDLDNAKIPSSSEFKNKPDGWETTAKEQDGNVWEMSQREEDILLQEFDRRIAYCKFQIASFIKTHIFSRRRPIDGWKYMIEEIGPNARKGKGSVSRLPGLSDPSTQPFKEDRTPISGSLTPSRGR